MGFWPISLVVLLLWRTVVSFGPCWLIWRRSSFETGFWTFFESNFYRLQLDAPSDNDDKTNFSRSFPGPPLSVFHLIDRWKGARRWALSVRGLTFGKISYVTFGHEFYKKRYRKAIKQKMIPSKPYAFIASGGQIGLLIVGSAGSWLAHSYQWDKLFQFIGFLSFIWILLLYRMNKQYKAQSKYSYTPIQKGTVGIL